MPESLLFSFMQSFICCYAMFVLHTLFLTQTHTHANALSALPLSANGSPEGASCCYAENEPTGRLKVRHCGLGGSSFVLPIIETGGSLRDVIGRNDLWCGAPLKIRLVQ